MPTKELDVDAAIIFADIMLPLEGVGVRFEIEENVGPVIINPVSSADDVDNLTDFEAEKHVPHLLEAIREVKYALDSKIALIGFSGAPFTIASYLIEGKSTRDFAKTKALMFNETEVWKTLMKKLTKTISDYLCAQIESGVDVVQLFDSWVGTLGKTEYDEFVLPYVEQILDRVKRDHPEIPTIHFGTNTQHLLESMKNTKSDVFSVDWRTSIAETRETLGNSFGIQGNLDPAVLLSNDREGFIRQRIQMVLDDNAERNSHIFNLGHGILRETPVENVKFTANYVHRNS